MKIYLVLILAILLCLVFTKEEKRPYKEVPEGGFSGVFAASWLGGFCWNMREHSDKCQKKYFELWDRQSFTIHGLWPSIQKIFGRTHATDVFDHTKFDLNSDLFKKMKEYWPPKSRDGQRQWKSEEEKKQKDNWLWFHQYQDHGRDYARLLKIYNPVAYGNLSPQEFQEKYFNAVINFYLKQNLRKLNPKMASPHAQQNKEGDLVLNKQQLSQIINIKQEYFVVKCIVEQQKYYTDILKEIKICYRIRNDEDITIQYAKCTQINGEAHIKTKDQCLPTFKLTQYKKTDQIPVIKYEGYSTEHGTQL